MKNLRPFARLFVAGIGLTGLSTGCNPDEVTGPRGDCRIQRIVSTTKGQSSEGTTETVYDYDAAGRLSRKTLTGTTTQSGGGSNNTVTTTDTYAYSPDSLLTTYTSATRQEVVNAAGKTSTYQLTTTQTYAYTNNRLAGYTQRNVVSDAGLTSGPQTRTYVSTATYEYDAAGQLVKENSGGATWTYRNGQAVDFKSYFPYVLEKGLITKATFPGTNGSGNALTLVQAFDYDAQRRLIKYQEFRNDTLDSYRTQTWQTGMPATAALPRFKGHPVVQSPSGEIGVLTECSHYFINHRQADAAYPFSKQTYTNQLNAQGYVTSSRAETTYFTNGLPPEVTTTTYAYTGCH